MQSQQCCSHSAWCDLHVAVLAMVPASCTNAIAIIVMGSPISSWCLNTPRATQHCTTQWAPIGRWGLRFLVVAFTSFTNTGFGGAKEISKAVAWFVTIQCLYSGNHYSARLLGCRVVLSCLYIGQAANECLPLSIVTTLSV